MLYLRYSSNSQTEQSIEGQRRACRKFCEQEDLQIVDEYVDRAASASHDTQKRLGFLQMIEDSYRKKFDVVVVYKLDRFARSRYDAATYRHKLNQSGVRLLSATEPLSGRPGDVLMESMLEGMAEYYSLELAEKVNRGIAESIEKRQWLGGPLPFGFKIENKKLVPDPATAPIVREVFAKVLEGLNFRQIADWMSSQGIRSKNGKPFSLPGISRMLHSKRYIGYYCYRDLEIPGAIEPIIDEETFEAVQRRLKAVARKHHDQTDYLLSGKLFCGHCGRQMNGEKGKSKNGNYYHYYSCLGKKKKFGCEKKAIRKDEIEGIVVDRARQMLTDEVIDEVVCLMMDEFEKRAKDEDPTTEITTQIQDLDKQIENGLNAVLAGFGSKPLADKLDALNQQKDELQRRMQEIRDSRIDIDPDRIRFYLLQLRAGADDNPKMRKRLIQTFIQKVILWDDPEGRNRKMQIVYNLSNYSEEFDCSCSVAKAPPFENDTNTIKIHLDQMVMIVNYTLI